MFEVISKMREAHEHVISCSACRAALTNGTSRNICQRTTRTLGAALAAYSRAILFTMSTPEQRRARMFIDRIREERGMPAQLDQTALW